MQLTNPFSKQWNCLRSLLLFFFCENILSQDGSSFKQLRWPSGTWSWPSGWCIGLRSWLRGFDAQLGHLYDACASLPQKYQAAIKWLEIRKK